MAPPNRRPTIQALIALALVLAAARCQSGTPPPSTVASTGPVVYFQQAPVTAWQAVDWNGKFHGSVGTDRVGIPLQSPDGSRLLWSPEGVWQFVDNKGHLLSVPDLSRSREITWSDDSSGVCVLNGLTFNSTGGGSSQLVFVSATGGSRNITSLTTRKGPNIAACSPAANRVVITAASGYKDPRTMLRRVTFDELRVIDFQTGKVAFRQSTPIGKPATEVSSIVVSHDGSFAALGTQSQTTIVNLSNGQIVSRASAVIPLAFSWDTKLLAVFQASNRGAVLSPSTGQVVWKESVADRVTQGAVPKPGGSDLMLFVTGGDLDDLLVVSPGGSSRIVAKGVFPDQIAPCFDCSAS
jgi:hypothetical protein